MNGVYFDARHKRIYITCGRELPSGVVFVYQQKDPDHYERMIRIPTVVGARTAGYTPKVGKKGLDRIFLLLPFDSMLEQGMKLTFLALFVLPTRRSQ